MQKKTPRVAIFGLISKHRGRNRGGTAVSVVRLANYLAEYGIKVDIVMRRQGPEFEWPRAPNAAVNVHQLRADQKIALFLGLCSYLLRYRPSAMVAVDMRPNRIAGWTCCIPLLRVTTVATIRNAIAAQAAGWKTRKMSAKIRDLRAIYRRCNSVVAVSRGLADEFADMAGVPREAIKVIHNSILTEDIERRASTPAAHPWLIEKTHPVILSVGRLDRQKDFPTLIRAFALLRAKRECRLIILGRGEDEEALKRLARQLGVESDVSLPGFAVNPFAYMARAELFVLSSRWEGFPNVLVEAMTVGKRLVATDCPHGPREILADGRYGYLVPVGDENALAKAMGAALDTPADSDILRRGAERFCVTNQERRYLKLLNLSPALPESR